MIIFLFIYFYFHFFIFDYLFSAFQQITEHTNKCASDNLVKSLSNGYQSNH